MPRTSGRAKRMARTLARARERGQDAEPDRRDADDRRRDPLGPHPRHQHAAPRRRRWPRTASRSARRGWCPTSPTEIVAAVNALRARYDHVFTSGGIGPTHDDITADAIAAAFGVPIDVREDARAILATNYANPEVELNEARLRMARIPDGATLIDNPVSKAPGFTPRQRPRDGRGAGGLPGDGRGAAAAPDRRPAAALARSVRIDRPEGEIAGPLRAVAEAHPAVVDRQLPVQPRRPLRRQPRRPQRRPGGARRGRRGARGRSPGRSNRRLTRWHPT